MKSTKRFFVEQEREKGEKIYDPFDAPADDAADDMFDMPVGDDDNVRVFFFFLKIFIENFDRSEISRSRRLGIGTILLWKRRKKLSKRRGTERGESQTHTQGQ